MKSAKVENGRVVNVILGEMEGYVPVTDNVQIGWLHDGNSFYPSEPEPESIDPWPDLRAKRDALLAESDWTQLPDAPVDAKAWAVYRQALRDLPENTTDPADPVWPVNPIE